MKEEHINEIKAIVVLAIGMILLASLISFVPEDLPWYTSYPNVPAQNMIRITGAYLAGSLLFLLGYSAYFLVLFMFFWSWNKFSSRELNFTWAKLISAVVLFSVISALFSMLGPQESILRFHRAGMIGILLADFLVNYLGFFGTYTILIMLGTLALILTGEFLVTPLFMKIFENIKTSPERVVKSGTITPVKEKKKFNFPAIVPNINFGIPVKQKSNTAVQEEKLKAIKGEEAARDRFKDKENTYGIAEKNEGAADRKQEISKPKIKITETPKDDSVDEGIIEPKIVGEYKIPSLELLENSPAIPTNKLQNSLMNGAKLLEETLASFGVAARVADIERGPAITRYELEPAPGVKVQKFTVLADDIALAMRAPTVRIVAPIPGKNRVGIEVPNDASASVYLKDVLSSGEYRKMADRSKLALALGKDIAGKPMVADLAEMPHLLIAGTTGSGKTVCVNSIIMSMLFNASPAEVRFIMVDPKMVELAGYNDIPHLLCPTVTDAKKASNVLNWAVAEMESRYRKLSKDGTKNIKAYTAKGHYMPYIVIVIDELADLMQVSAKTVESSIMRLAQLSRAVGIHLILATQRPSVNVITGVIKANFPARISFKVASKVDSRTVLDMNGAETLLGKGDMLFMQPGDAKPTRGQGNFVKDLEINRVIQHIKDQQAPSYDENILNSQKSGAVGGSEDSDEYYDEAVKLVIETNQASVSILQRRLRLGYTRAARLIDMMEQNGIVGPYCGSKPRDILVDREQWLLKNMNQEEKQDGV